MATNDLTIYFLNVGQGHCAFLKLPNGEGVLLDINHSREGGIHVLNFLRDYLSKEMNGEINYVIVSHPDKDHCRGLKDIWDSPDLSIGKLFDSTLRKEKEEGGEYPEYDAYIEILNKLREQGRVAPVKRSLDYHPDLKFEWGGIRFYSPEKDFSNQELGSEEINRKSLIVKLDFYDASIVFGADTSFLTYKEDLKSWKNFTFSMLKGKLLLASHHGSRTFFRRNEEEYPYTEALDAIDPEYTIISVGKNPHGHPHKDAIDLYEGKSKKVYRTDRDNSIVVTIRKLHAGGVAMDVSPDSTIDSKYTWGDDNGDDGNSSGGKGPATIPSWKRRSPSVLGGSPKG